MIPDTVTFNFLPFYQAISIPTVSPSLQVDPVQPTAQVHVLGAVHTPPF